MGSTQSLGYTSSHCGIFPALKSEYIWLVKDFKKLLAEDVGYSTCSDDLCARGKEGIDDTETFKLVFYPNGFNERVKGYASLWLQKLSSNERRIKFTCAVISVHGDAELLSKCVTQSLGLETCLGWIAFCRKNIISSALMNDTLKLKCTIEILSEKAFANPEDKDSELVESVLLSELSSDLGLIVSEKDYSDFSIEVQGRCLYAHKAVLSARSPVFKAMFKSKLTTTSKIKVSDISEHTLKEMLNFIYSGKVGILDFQEAMDLYYAADKYALIGLKNICYNILKNNLQIDNVLRVLSLSDRHSDEDLKEVCIAYIVKNASQVQEPKEWINFCKNQPELASVVFRRLVSRQYW